MSAAANHRQRGSINGDCEHFFTEDYSISYQHRVKLDNAAREDEEDDEEKEDVSNVNAQQKNDNDISCLWEIRIKNNLKEEGISNSNKQGDEILLKNILTGQFLYYDAESQNLTLEDLHDKTKSARGFEFFLKMKNNWTSDNFLKFNSLVTLKNAINKTHINFYEESFEEYEVKVSNSQQNSYRFFVIENAGNEKLIAFKIKEINSYINKFYQVRLTSSCKTSESARKPGTNGIR